MSPLPQEDLDDVISIATKSIEKKKDYLTTAELNTIAEELGIGADALKAAQAQLKADRAAAELRKTERRRNLQIASGIGLLIAAGLLFNGISTKSTLDDELVDVRKTQSQLLSVTARQQKVEARWADTPASRDKTAELAGAENRVRIQQKRYDAKAANYNRQANGILARVWCKFFGLPTQIPLSSDAAFRASEPPK